MKMESEHLVSAFFLTKHDNLYHSLVNLHKKDVTEIAFTQYCSNLDIRKFNKFIRSDL